MGKSKQPMTKSAFIISIVLSAILLVASLAMFILTGVTYMDSKNMPIYYQNESIQFVRTNEYVFELDFFNRTEEDVVIDKLVFRAYSSANRRVIYEGDVSSHTYDQIVVRGGGEAEHMAFTLTLYGDNPIFDRIECYSATIDGKEYRVSKNPDAGYVDTALLVSGIFAFALGGIYLAITLVKFFKDKKKTAPATSKAPQNKEKEIVINELHSSSEESKQEATPKYIKVSEVIPHKDPVTGEKLKSTIIKQDDYVLEEKIFGKNQYKIKISALDDNSVTIVGVTSPVSEIIDGKFRRDIAGTVILSRGEKKRVTVIAKDKKGYFVVEFPEKEY